MGLSSSSTTQTTGPSAQALPYLQAGSSALQGQYAASQPNTSAITSGLGSAFSGLLGATQNNPTLAAANAYDTNLLSGSYTPSSQLAGIEADTNNNVANSVNGEFSLAGQNGSSRQTGELARQTATADNALQYTDYQNYLSQQQAAATNAGNLTSAQDGQYSTLGTLGTQATTQPLLGASMLASGLGSLWDNSQTSTTNQSGSLLSSLGGILGAGLSGWAGGGFKT